MVLELVVRGTALSVFPVGQRLLFGSYVKVRWELFGSYNGSRQ
jgi:hypothetical protein